MKKLDAIDLKILDALQRDGRLPNVALAKAVGLSPTPCAERVRALEASGIIAGYCARLDAGAVTSALAAQARRRAEYPARGGDSTHESPRTSHPLVTTAPPDALSSPQPLLDRGRRFRPLAQDELLDLAGRGLRQLAEDN